MANGSQFLGSAVQLAHAGTFSGIFRGYKSNLRTGKIFRPTHILINHALAFLGIHHMRLRMNSQNI